MLITSIANQRVNGIELKGWFGFENLSMTLHFIFGTCYPTMNLYIFS